MHHTHIALRFLSYLRADGVFLPPTVPDAPVHGEIEGEEFEWNDANAHAGPGAPCDNLQNHDLTEVQNAIAGVSSSHGTLLLFQAIALSASLYSSVPNAHPHV